MLGDFVIHISHNVQPPPKVLQGQFICVFVFIQALAAIDIPHSAYKRLCF